MSCTGLYIVYICNPQKLNKSNFWWDPPVSRTTEFEITVTKTKLVMLSSFSPDGQQRTLSNECKQLLPWVICWNDWCQDGTGLEVCKPCESWSGSGQTLAHWPSLLSLCPYVRRAHTGFCITCCYIDYILNIIDSRSNRHVGHLCITMQQLSTNYFKCQVFQYHCS